MCRKRKLIILEKISGMEGDMPRVLRMTKLLLLIMGLAFTTVAQAGGGYVDNQDGTISDPEHGIMWQKADDGVERSWREAGQYCESLALAGHDDWTLPKAYQLEGLIDTAHSPTIDPLFAVKASYYWSATDSASSPDSAKYVNFFYGNTYPYSKDNPYYVLCVREVAATPGKGLSVVFAGASVGGKPLASRFTAAVSGGSEPYFYEWDFGDGNTAGAETPTHEFAKEGQYQVILTVSDNNGAVAVANQEITLPLAVVPATGEGPSVAPAAASAETVPVLSEAVPKATDLPPKAADDGAISGAMPRPGVAARSAEATEESGPAKIALVSRKSGMPQGAVDVLVSGQGASNKEGALDHGLLAHTLAKAMAGEGDANKDGSLTTAELQGYLEPTIKDLSKGQQSPVISRGGDDFAVCAPGGSSTYVLAIGIDHDLAGTALRAGLDAELVRKTVEDKCPITKTMMLTADHANRQDILQAVLQIGSMVTASDTLLVYIGAANGQDNGRLNWYVNDSNQELPWFTGIYHEDLLQLLKTLPVGHLLVLGEKN